MAQVIKYLFAYAEFMSWFDLKKVIGTQCVSCMSKGKCIDIIHKCASHTFILCISAWLR